MLLDRRYDRRALARTLVPLMGGTFLAATLSGSAFAQTATSTPGMAMGGTPATTGTSTSTTTGSGAGTPAASSMALPTAAPTMVSQATVQSPSDLRVAMNSLLLEHTLLAGMTADAIVGQRQSAAQAAATVLDSNSQELAQLVGSFYGSDAQQQFLTLWRRHISDYATYSQATVANDQASKDSARQDLNGFVQDFDTFFSSANPNIQPGSLVQPMTMHVMGTLQVIDALGAKDYMTAYSLGKAGAEMSAQMGDPLSTAIVAQFPDQFTSASAAGQS
jgi:uncharacterized protein YcfL